LTRKTKQNERELPRKTQIPRYFLVFWLPKTGKTTKKKGNFRLLGSHPWIRIPKDMPYPFLANKMPLLCLAISFPVLFCPNNIKLVYTPPRYLKIDSFILFLFFFLPFTVPLLLVCFQSPLQRPLNCPPTKRPPPFSFDIQEKQTTPKHHVRRWSGVVCGLRGRKRTKKPFPGGCLEAIFYPTIVPTLSDN
jgi:hypothetical protein